METWRKLNQEHTTEIKNPDNDENDYPKRGFAESKIGESMIGIDGKLIVNEEKNILLNRFQSGRRITSLKTRAVTKVAAHVSEAAHVVPVVLGSPGGPTLRVELHLDDYNPIGLNADLGRSSALNSKKRPRRFRSPEVVDIDPVLEYSGLPFPDLNCLVPETCPSASILSFVDHLVRHSPMEVSDDSIPIEFSGGVNCTSREVEDTIQVAARIDPVVLGSPGGPTLRVELHLDDYNPIGLNADLGRSSALNSKKRPRRFRSPEVVDIDSGLEYSGLPFPDLNCLVPETCPSASILSLVDHLVRHSPLEVSDDLIPREFSGGVNCTSREVEDTIQVGVGIGIQLAEFEDQVRFLVDGECAKIVGGLLCVWNPGIFSKNNVIRRRHYLLVSGILLNPGIVGNLVNIHAPNDPGMCRGVWDELLNLKNSCPGFWIFLGDFNDVCGSEERLNSEFSPSNATFFNSFIEETDLLEYNMGGVNSLTCRIMEQSLVSWIDFWTKKLVKEEEYKTNKDRIEALEILVESRPLSSLELEDRIRCKKWAIDGDENSYLFHSMVNANVSNNRINGLDFDGEWIDNLALLKEKIGDFFAEKFLEPSDLRPKVKYFNISRLEDYEADSLVVQFTRTEIKTAVWECGDNKAPGPDEFSFRFLKTFWACFEADFYKMFQEFHEGAKLSRGCTSSFIALISKVVDPTVIQKFRPISLIGCVNKVVLKVLVNRLKGVIGKLISVEQSGFLSGRIDIDKAFDSLNWGFLDSVMDQMSFPAKWRAWIMACVSSAKGTVLVNRSPTREFDCFNRLRQGEPLSPFLFIIAMEALNCVMNRAASLGFYHAELNELHGISHALSSVALSRSADKWRRVIDPSGWFSVSSLKRQINSVSLSSPKYVFYWNNWVPTKVGVVVWRAELDRLPTKGALIRRNIKVQSPWCVLCGEVEETSEHVLISCAFTQDVWQVVFQWCKILPFFAYDVRDLLGIFKFIPRGEKKTKSLHVVILTTIWCI
ncbi:hypothetical protein L1987_38243 [Smallanthus sonchifolius]|uniref:Uncharacterized protein n=1 Tax=Smallanthus sonchifolius TaxID=185202 RepID=A0ACB9HIZ1_9ASTR|nr:hypothetical protein L1987_38243 [Smallanthus sonchifolius]